MTPFESLPVEVQEVVKSARDLAWETVMFGKFEYQKTMAQKLKDRIEAFWPQFGEERQ